MLPHFIEVLSKQRENRKQKSHAKPGALNELLAFEVRSLGFADINLFCEHDAKKIRKIL